MAYDLDSDSHSVYSLHYHLVLVTADRDVNAAWNVLQRGFENVGMG